MHSCGTQVSQVELPTALRGEEALNGQTTEVVATKAILTLRTGVTIYAKSV